MGGKVGVGGSARAGIIRSMAGGKAYPPRRHSHGHMCSVITIKPAKIGLAAVRAATRTRLDHPINCRYAGGEVGPEQAEGR